MKQTSWSPEVYTQLLNKEYWKIILKFWALFIKNVGQKFFGSQSGIVPNHLELSNLYNLHGTLCQSRTFGHSFKVCIECSYDVTKNQNQFIKKKISLSFVIFCYFMVVKQSKPQMPIQLITRTACIYDLCKMIIKNSNCTKTIKLIFSTISDLEVIGIRTIQRRSSSSLSSWSW